MLDGGSISSMDVLAAMDVEEDDTEDTESSESVAHLMWSLVLR